MMGWQRHQLDHMQIICTLLQTDNHASTSPLSFLQDGCPSCHPTNSVKALKAYLASIHYHEIDRPISSHYNMQPSLREAIMVKTMYCT